MQSPTIDDLPDLLTPQDLIDVLPGVGRDAVYLLLQRGEIPSVRIGRKFVIAKAALKSFLGIGVESAPTASVPGSGRKAKTLERIG